MNIHVMILFKTRKDKQIIRCQIRPSHFYHANNIYWSVKFTVEFITKFHFIKLIRQSNWYTLTVNENAI